jgi:hypothetical protein
MARQALLEAQDHQQTQSDSVSPEADSRTSSHSAVAMLPRHDSLSYTWRDSADTATRPSHPSFPGWSSVSPRANSEPAMSGDGSVSTAQQRAWWSKLTSAWLPRSPEQPLPRQQRSGLYTIIPMSGAQMRDAACVRKSRMQR